GLDVHGGAGVREQQSEHDDHGGADEMRHHPSTAASASLTVATPLTASGIEPSTLLFGTMAALKPSCAAARRRGSMPLTARTSPVSPTSPSRSTSGGTGRSR